MRLSKEKLTEITDREQPAAQARWFDAHFGLHIDYDRQGPIITEAAFQALIMKKLGLQTANDIDSRPRVKKVRAAA